MRSLSKIPNKTRSAKDVIQGRSPGKPWVNLKTQGIHPWRVTVAEAKAIQERLRGGLTLSGAPRRVKLIAGADLSYPRFSSRAVAGVVVLSWPELEVVETRTVSGLMTFPYVPGYLSFRECPLLLKAFKQLRSDPQLIFFDGQGVAHPRGIGLASHMGLFLDRPSIGCAKSLLYGQEIEPEKEAGSRTVLLAPDGRPIGVTLRTRTGVKPVYISPGHRIGRKAAADWAFRMCRGYRIPEPVRQAHLLVNHRRRVLFGTTNQVPLR